MKPISLVPILSFGVLALATTPSHADGQPRAPDTHAAPRRPAPPPPPQRPSSAAELAGTWTVKLSTRLSTCTNIAAPGVADWTIAFDDGAIALESADGTKLAGALDKIIGSTIRTTLRPGKRTSSRALQLTMFVKDRLHGSYVRTENTGDPADPVCVIVQEISGTRR